MSDPCEDLRTGRSTEIGDESGVEGESSREESVKGCNKRVVGDSNRYFSAPVILGVNTGLAGK